MTPDSDPIVRLDEPSFAEGIYTAAGMAKQPADPAAMLAFRNAFLDLCAAHGIYAAELVWHSGQAAASAHYYGPEMVRHINGIMHAAGVPDTPAETLPDKAQAAALTHLAAVLPQLHAEHTRRSLGLAECLRAAFPGLRVVSSPATYGTRN